MKILITGGYGFLGYNLFQWLRRNQEEADIWLFDHRFGQDIMNDDQLDAAVQGKDLVIHMAAMTHVDDSTATPIPFYEINTVGTAKVLEACHRHKVKMLHLSSSEVYGTNEFPGVPMPETHRLVGHSHYAASKIGADRACIAAYLNKNQDVVIVRPFNQYGYGQAVDKVIPKWINQAYWGEPITVRGDGTHTKDYVFAQDTAAAIWAAKDLPAGEIVNIGTGNAYSLNEIADLIIKTVNQKNPSMVVHTQQIKARVGGLEELRGSYERLNQLTGWEPKVSLEEGIRLCVDWYFANGYIKPPQVPRKG